MANTDYLIFLVLVTILLIPFMFSPTCTARSMFFLYIVIIATVIVLHITKKRIHPIPAEHFVPENIFTEVIPTNLCENIELYLTTTGHNSFDESSLTWKDIHREPDTRTTRNFTFSALPPFGQSKYDGIQMNNITIKGPMSIDMGIRSTDNFSFVWYASIASISDTYIPFFALHANTWSNILIEVGFRGSTLVIKENFDTDTTLNERVFTYPANAIGAYKLFAVVKNQTSLKVYVDCAQQPLYVSSTQSGNTQATGNPQTTPSNSSSPTYEVAIASNDILLSNKEFSIKSVPMTLRTFALYRKAIDVSFMQSLKTYIENRRITLNDSYIDLLDQVRQSENRASCALQDTSVCSRSCPQVTNWTNMNDIMKNASDGCKAAITTYCTNNTTDPFCNCWLPENENNASCGVVRSFFADNLIPRSSCPVQDDVTRDSANPRFLEKYYTGLHIPTGTTGSTGTASSTGSSSNTTSSTNTTLSSTTSSNTTLTNTSSSDNSSNIANTILEQNADIANIFSNGGIITPEALRTMTEPNLSSSSTTSPPPPFPFTGTTPNDNLVNRLF